MEEDEIKKQAQKDAKELWENELEKPFLEKINESLLLMMKNIDSQFLAYEKKFNSIIKGIEKNSMNNSSQNSVQKSSLSSSIISDNNPNKIDIEKITKPYTKLTLLDDVNPLINLIIQCLCNIKTFMAYYFNPNKEEKILRKFRNNPNNLYLGPGYLNLLKKVWEDLKEEYSPREIHNILKGLMKDDYKSNNSGHIMKFIIDQLYSELNNDNDLLINLDNFKDSSYLPKNKILNTAYPFIKTKKTCLSCGKIVDNYFSVSPVINIYLDESNDESTKFFNLENDLNKLLIERGKEQILVDCQTCKKQQDIMVSKSVKEASEITIFYIDRKNDPNHEISLFYSHSMNLCMDSSNTKFDLITVIKDLPFNSDGSLSHIAYIRSLINHKWYSYDNKEIKLLQDENEVLDGKYVSLLIYSPPKSN